eukprot:Nitzschia sp. Nitz4//scaffold10_size219509//15886//18247//NITZ4_001394-RA/size219509-augustus-gene-0.209-mRNA-1//1//CDS//3329532818//4409//frame0
MSEGLLLSFDEKKEDPPMSDMKEDPFDPSSAPLPSITLSPSKRRAKAASSAGLSELSKQLRILQAKNEAQSVEINRLERQLRILAELQGISVADLRKALEDACANEAFGELQNRVAKLRAELEAANLAKQKELRQDATAPHIANLELRVGELEEVEEKHQTEIHHLYEQLRHERARATRLEAEGAQHKQDAQDYLDRLNKEKARGSKLEATFQDQLQKYQLEQARKMQELAKMAKEAELRRLAMSRNGALNDPNGSEAARSRGTDTAGTGATLGASGHGSHDQNADGVNARGSGSDPLGNGIDFGSFGIDIRGLSPEEALAAIAPHMLAEHERMLKLLKEKEDALRAAQAQLQAEKDQWLKQQREAEEAARQAQLNLQMDKDKMSLTIKELADTESQNDLRLAQFKARFSVQDEHIADMEQQLDSLYTAFGIIKEEQDADELKRAALQCNLNEADEEMAKQVHDEQNKGQNRSHSVVGSPPAARPQVVDPWDTTARDPSTPNSAHSSRVPNTILTASPGWASPVVATPTRASAANSPRTSASNQRSVGLYSPTTMASPRSRGITTPTVTAQPYTTPPRTPGTWQLIFPEPHTTSTRSYDPSNSHNQDGLLIRGNLIVKSKSMMRKWKSKHCKLYLRGNHYQWDMEGKSYTLGFGISKVEYYPNHPLAFTVWTNPYDEMAPVIHAAASNEDDYNRWMGALTKATTGGEYNGNSQLVHRLSSSAASSSPSVHPSSAESVVSALSAEDQEAADLDRALRLSETVM